MPLFVGDLLFDLLGCFHHILFEISVIEGHCRFLNFDMRVVFHSDDESLLTDIDNFAMDAADGDDMASFCESLAGFLKFLLFFLLRTNHEEVENDDEQHNHDHGWYPTSLLLTGFAI